MRILIELTVDETRAAAISGALDEFALFIKEEHAKQKASIEDLLKSKEDTYRLKPKAEPAPEKETPPWEEPEVLPETTKDEAKEVTKEMVRAVLGDLQKAGKKTEIQELLAKYGVKKFTDVDQKDYASMLAEAEKI